MKHDDSTLPVRRFIDEVMNRGEIRMLSEIVADDFSFVTPATTHFGLADFEIYMGELLDAWKGFHVTVHDLIADRSNVSAKVDFEATPVKEFLGIPPSFRKFQLPAVCRFKIYKEKIKSLKIDYDFAKLLSAD